MAYTIKGWGTPLAGHKDNHAGLMTKEQMDKFKNKMQIKNGEEWNNVEKDLREYIDNLPFRKGRS